MPLNADEIARRVHDELGVRLDSDWGDDWDYLDSLNVAVRYRNMKEARGWTSPLERVVGEYPLQYSLQEKDLERVGAHQAQFLAWLEQNKPDKHWRFDATQPRQVFYTDEDGEEHQMRLADAIQDAPQALKGKLTQFPQIRSAERVRMVITMDPVALIGKSTSKKWSSCESLGDFASAGPFSDIQHGNAIAYFYEGDKTQPFGRFMLRWCNTDDGEPNIGIEPSIYPKGDASEFPRYLELSNVLTEKGFGNYEKCETPYTYEGYSDIMGGDKTHIEYWPFGTKGMEYMARHSELSRSSIQTFINAGGRLKEIASHSHNLRSYPDIVKRWLSWESEPNIINNILLNGYGLGSEVSCDTVERVSQIPGVPAKSLVGLSVPEKCFCSFYDRMAARPDVTPQDAAKLAAHSSYPADCGCRTLTAALAAVDKSNPAATDEDRTTVYNAIASRAKIASILEPCKCAVIGAAAVSKSLPIQKEARESPDFKTCYGGVDRVSGFQKDDKVRIVGPVNNDGADYPFWDAGAGVKHDLVGMTGKVVDLNDGWHVSVHVDNGKRYGFKNSWLEKLQPT